MIEENLKDVETNWPKNLPQGIIHADLFHDNIFFEKEKFSGNLLDYIELVQQDPSIVKSSHKRLYDALIHHGVNHMPDSDARKKKIRVFISCYAMTFA